MKAFRQKIKKRQKNHCFAAIELQFCKNKFTPYKKCEKCDRKKITAFLIEKNDNFFTAKTQRKQFFTAINHSFSGKKLTILSNRKLKLCYDFKKRDFPQ